MQSKNGAQYLNVDCLFLSSGVCAAALVPASSVVIASLKRMYASI